MLVEVAATLRAHQRYWNTLPTQHSQFTRDRELLFCGSESIRRIEKALILAKVLPAEQGDMWTN